MKKLFVLLMVLGTLFATLSIDSYSVSPSVMSPGQSGYVSVTLKNVLATGVTGSQSIDGVTLYITTPKGLESDRDTVIIGTLEGGTSTTSTFQIRALTTAKGGVYTISVTANDKTSSPKTTTIPITISNPPIFTLTTDKDVLTTSDQINLNIKNEGGYVNRLTIKFNTTDFGLVGSDQAYIGKVEKNATVNLNIDSRNAKDGVNKIPLLLTYYDESGNLMSEIKYITIAVKKEKLELTFLQTQSLVTSKEGDLSLTIKNTGNDISDLRLVLSDDNVKTTGNNEIKLGDIKKDEQVSMVLPVIANLEPGLKQIKFIAKWVEGNVDKEQEVLVPVKILSDSVLGIFIDAKPTPIRSGSEHTLSVLISNEGSYGVSNVKVKVASEFFDSLNAEDSQFVGSLDSDDFSTVQYKIRINAIAEGSYPINIIVSYKDKSGELVTKEIVKDMQVREAEKKDSGLLPAIILILIASAAYWYFKMRKPAIQNSN